MNSYKAEGWSTCNCGKEFWCVERAETQELADMMLRIHQMSACKSCEADYHIADDSCPQSVPIEGGVSACGLPWHHVGQCEPELTHEDTQEIARLHRVRQQ